MFGGMVVVVACNLVLSSFKTRVRDLGHVLTVLDHVLVSTTVFGDFQLGSSSLDRSTSV